MGKNIIMITPVEEELLQDFCEYCKDHSLTLAEGVIKSMRNATGTKAKRVRVKIKKEVNGTQ